VSVTIDPEPSDDEREAILAALQEPGTAPLGEWAEAALREGVESVEDEP
jgi:hypothetical protein